MSSPQQQGLRARRPVVVGALLLAVAGVVLLVVALTSQRHAPQPPASAAIAYSTSAVPQSGAGGSSPAADPAGTSSSTIARSTAAGHPAPSTAGPTGPKLSRSQPTRLDIPSIGVTSDLLDLGLAADNSVEVPPLGKDSQAGWFHDSPTPGQIGPSVILGHVDSAKYGPGVFFKLGALKPGSTVNVTRSDKSVAVFRVDRVVSYSKNQFPTLEVYGNTANAALRLITCGGKFDFTSHHYLSNIVAYASLVSSHHV